MCSKQMTQSQFTLKAVVEAIRDQIMFFNDRDLTHISRQLSYYAVTLGIGYHIHRYIITGLLPFEQFSEERLWTDKAEW